MEVGLSQCNYMTVQQPLDCWGAYGSSPLGIYLYALVYWETYRESIAAYLSPSTGYHEVLGLFVGESNETCARMLVVIVVDVTLEHTPLMPRKRVSACGSNPPAASG